MSDKLKPCPFCGQTPAWLSGGDFFVVVHNDDCILDNDGDVGYLRRTQTDAWNTRPVEDALRAKWQSVPWAALHTAIWLMASYLPGSKEADYDALIAFVESNAPQEATIAELEALRAQWASVPWNEITRATWQLEERTDLRETIEAWIIAHNEQNAPKEPTE